MRENLTLIIVIVAIITAFLTLAVQIFYAWLQRKGFLQKVRSFVYQSSNSFAVTLPDISWLQITLRWYFDAKFVLTETERGHYNNLFYRAIEKVIVQNECSTDFYQSEEFVLLLVKALQELIIDSTKKKSVFQLEVTLEKNCPRIQSVSLRRVLSPEDFVN